MDESIAKFDLTQFYDTIPIISDSWSIPRTLRDRTQDRIISIFVSLFSSPSLQSMRKTYISHPSTHVKSHSMQYLLIVVFEAGALARKSKAKLRKIDQRVTQLKESQRSFLSVSSRLSHAYAFTRKQNLFHS